VTQQLKDAAIGALPAYPTVEDLPKIIWKTRCFVQEDSRSQKGAEGRKSWIRSHGTFFIELNHQDQQLAMVA
jgi:hypothetical protein